MLSSCLSRMDSEALLVHFFLLCYVFHKLYWYCTGVFRHSAVFRLDCMDMITKMQPDLWLRSSINISAPSRMRKRYKLNLANIKYNYFSGTVWYSAPSWILTSSATSSELNLISNFSSYFAIIFYNLIYFSKIVKVDSQSFLVRR